MTVENNLKLMQLHSLLHLKLLHAAIGTYPCDGIGSMSVNRLLLIFEDDNQDKSFIHDMNSKNTLIMKAGSLYFIPCDHNIEFALTAATKFVSLHFNLDLFYGFDVFANYNKSVRIENPALVEESRKLVYNENEIKALCRLNEIIYNLCVNLLTEHPIKYRSENENWQQYAHILDYIQTQGSAATSVTKLAEMHNTRPDVFSRMFTRDMGVTPKTFIANTLMRKVTEALLTTDKKIRTIADEFNFSSEYYFSRFVKKHTGLSPRKFKQIHGRP